MLLPKTDLERNASFSPHNYLNLYNKLLEIGQSNELADFVIKNCE